MTAQRQIILRYARNIQPGVLTWIGVRPARREPMVALKAVTALASRGLEGDHRCRKTPGSGRQVTLISEEYIAQIAHFCGRDAVLPGQLRRNLVLRNINLAALRHQQFTIGDAVLEATALCHPCARMEETLGEGGVAAMLGHGGLCARILRSGRMALGDAVRILSE